MAELDVRLLRAFVTVADELSFSRAAERLGVAQQGLSAQVRQLESRLEARLFTRTTRRVALTPVGEALLPHARAAVAAVDAGAEAVRRAATEAENALVVAGLADAGELGAAVLAEFARRFPEVGVSTTEALPSQSALERDGGGPPVVAFVRPPFRGVNRLSTVTVTVEPRLAALPAEHPLAERPALEPGDLMGESWSWAGAIPDRVAEAYWLLDDHRYGPPARVAGRPASWPELLALVAAGRAVATVPATIAEAHARPGVAFVPVDGIEPSPLLLAWRPAAETAAVRELAEVARAATGSGARRARR